MKGGDVLIIMEFLVELKCPLTFGRFRLSLSSVHANGHTAVNWKSSCSYHADAIAAVAQWALWTLSPTFEQFLKRGLTVNSTCKIVVILGYDLFIHHSQEKKKQNLIWWCIDIDFILSVFDTKIRPKKNIYKSGYSGSVWMFLLWCSQLSIMFGFPCQMLLLKMVLVVIRFNL